MDPFECIDKLEELEATLSKEDIAKFQKRILTMVMVPFVEHLRRDVQQMEVTQGIMVRAYYNIGAL